jgi:hypothetical protein
MIREYKGYHNKPRLSLPVLLTWWGIGSCVIFFWGIIAFMLLAWVGGLN